ncbi:hypothetical protein FHD68_17220 [Paracoccus marcusii]|nr:hypothetical protein FHD68_17220 [Paracoccus marcusii]
MTIGDGGDVPSSKPISVSAPSLVDQMLAQAEAKTEPTVVVADGETASEAASQPVIKPGGMVPTQAPFSFSTPEELKVARTVLNVVIPQFSTKVSSIGDLNDPKVIERIADAAIAAQKPEEGFIPSITREQAVAVAQELCKHYVERTLAIPALTITPQQQVSFGFRRFDLDMKSWNFQPLSRELMIQVLRTEKTSRISGEDEGDTANRLEDYVVAKLIDYSEIDYDAHAAILYDLAGHCLGMTAQDAARLLFITVKTVACVDDCLKEAGADVSTIARSFGKTEAHVYRRLALAALPAAVLDALKTGHISYGMAKAFTVSQDEALTLQFLAEVMGRDVSEYRIKQALQPEAISGSDRRALFVGLDAYTAHPSATKVQLAPLRRGFFFGGE